MNTLIVPLLRGVAFKSYRFGYPRESLMITKKERVLISEDVKGWIWYMVFGGTSPYLSLRILIDEEYEDTISFYNLHTGGYETSLNQTWFLVRYDTANSLYVANYNPSSWFPIKKSLFVAVKLMEESPVDQALLMATRVEILKISNERKLRESIRELLWPVGILRTGRLLEAEG